MCGAFPCIAKTVASFALSLLQLGTACRHDPSLIHVLPCPLLYLGLIRGDDASPTHRNMPILELTQLRLKGVAPSDPSLLESLSFARGRLKTGSKFYACIEDPSLIFILGLWPSAEAHTRFLASPMRAEILGPQEEFLEFRWGVHMELDGMESLPLDAPILAIARLVIKGGEETAYEQATTKDAQVVSEHTRPYNVVNGYRCGSEPDNLREALVFTGWKSVESHEAFLSQASANEDSGFPAIQGLYESMDVWHTWDMEKGKP
jgi:heme-degrading monooxygenase HmoA